MKAQIKVLFRKQLEMSKGAKASSEVLLTQMKGVSETLNLTNLKLYRDLPSSSQSPITPSNRARPTAQTPEPW